jgi:glucose uptake protein GlcU
MLKCFKIVFKSLVILGALPMLFLLYGLFYKAVSENHDEADLTQYEKKFYQTIVKKCIIVYYVALAILMIWNNL